MKNSYLFKLVTKVNPLPQCWHIRFPVSSCFILICFFSFLAFLKALPHLLHGYECLREIWIFKWSNLPKVWSQSSHLKGFPWTKFTWVSKIKLLTKSCSQWGQSNFFLISIFLSHLCFKRFFSNSNNLLHTSQWNFFLFFWKLYYLESRIVCLKGDLHGGRKLGIFPHVWDWRRW